MKIFKHRNIMGSIFALMLSLPLLAVVARSAYVVVNKNAYQSYDNGQLQTYEKVVSFDQMQIGVTYDMYYHQFSSSNSAQTRIFKYSSINIDWTDYGFSDRQYIGFSVFGNSITRVYYTDTDYEQRYEWGNNLKEISFTVEDFLSNPTTNIDLTNSIFYFGTYSSLKLSNVFEYSLDKVIENNNFGNINFLEWFEDMFLSDNQVNNRYVHYFNWYLNYTMFVSCAYILFLCLMWFVNFSRRLLERGMNYDW